MPAPTFAARHARQAAALSVAVLLAGCGAVTTADSGGTAPSAPGYPVTVGNCGTEVRFNSAPQRVVTIKSTSTELLLALGLGDRIVGQAFADGPVPEEWSTEFDRIDALSDGAPSQEVILDKEPDLVYAGWESNLSADTAGDRETLAELGVNTYISPAACQGEDYKPDQMNFELLWTQFAEVGRIFGVPQAAADLIEKQNASLADVPRVAAPTTALWWSSGVDTPYVGAGTGAPQMVMDVLGLTNVAGDIEETWASLGWEAIVEADPDVIIIVDAVWSPAEQKMADLEGNEATAELTAVRERRYLVVPFPAAEAGVRSAPAAVALADQLSTLGLIDRN